MKTILIVDDEKDIRDLISYNLKKEGYGVIIAQNGREAVELARKGPDLILLDVMMPELDGWEVVKQLKKTTATATIPVIFLTARQSELDEVLGLELGATDFITKPVSMPKLLARIKSNLRKQETVPDEKETISLGIIRMDPAQHMVRIRDEEVFFPRKEFEILLYLMRHSGLVVTREMLLTAIWGASVFVVDRTIDVHIRKIREKLGDAADYIDTIKGVGYRMRGEEELTKGKR
jgi:two-component system, OmpR family, alkaline phosphatase synthesis response regulator PhoP